MQVTHEKARQLIQFAFDGDMDIRQKQFLASHLATCRECQRYADSMQNMESVLRPLLQRQWNRQPLPLSASILTSRAYAKTSDGMVLATRIAAIGVMFVIFMFSAWQFTFSKPSSSSPVAASVPPIPIPSTSTELATTTETQTCERTVYVVQEHDTLESVADHFAVSKEELITVNHMKRNAMQIGMTLVIPDCNFTPTANISTTTYTPILSTITSTPGG